MQLFRGSSSDFFRMNRDNSLADHLRSAFFDYFGYYPGHNEVASWRNSLFRLSIVLEEANLKDHGVFVEYQLPMTSRRLDCMICGLDRNGYPRSVIIELKQWETCRLSDFDGEYVVTWVGGGNRDVLHPAIQAGNYCHYLRNHKTVFYEGNQPVDLAACSFLHNYQILQDDVLLDARFSDAIKRFPIFSKSETTSLKDYLVNYLEGGRGMEILERIERSDHRPSPKLLEQLSVTLKEKLAGNSSLLGGGKDYILLDDQLVVYDSIHSIVTKGLFKKKKHTVIVTGGPGTGKSVIALQLMANLAVKGINTAYATGSRSFTQTLRKIVGSRYSSFFKYFMSFYKDAPDSYDVLILDEAHRIRERTVVFRQYSGDIPQVEEIIDAARVSLFLIDEDQVVRPGEIGSVEHIKQHAKKQGCAIHEFSLESQFRCNGSDAFIQWVNNTLQIRRTANAIWYGNEGFDFRILPFPEELDKIIKDRLQEGFTARITAGFCWPWSTELNPDGSLKNDITIGDFLRPWNARDNATGLQRGIPKAPLWAYDPGGVDQVGCIYTAQGFEFDYVGVIFGNDLKYDFEKSTWIGHPENSHDNQVKKNRDQFMRMVKNTYRVLLTRGMKGCYICFLDKDTERFVKSRIGQ